jgi:hypothetical protein
MESSNQQTNRLTNQPNQTKPKQPTIPPLPTQQHPTRYNTLGKTRTRKYKEIFKHRYNTQGNKNTYKQRVPTNLDEKLAAQL